MNESVSFHIPFDLNGESYNASLMKTEKCKFINQLGADAQNFHDNEWVLSIKYLVKIAGLQCARLH